MHVLNSIHLLCMWSFWRVIHRWNEVVCKCVYPTYQNDWWNLFSVNIQWRIIVHKYAIAEFSKSDLWSKRWNPCLNLVAYSNTFIITKPIFWFPCLFWLIKWRTWTARKLRVLLSNCKFMYLFIKYFLCLCLRPIYKLLSHRTRMCFSGWSSWVQRGGVTTPFLLTKCRFQVEK